jgi:hypothetical protein
MYLRLAYGIASCDDLIFEMLARVQFRDPADAIDISTRVLARGMDIHASTN